MAAMAMSHTTRAMNRSFAGFTAWSTTDTFHRACVALAKARGTLAVGAAAFATSAQRMSVLGMQGGLVRPVGVAHEPAKVESVVAGNFAPAFPSLVHRYDVVEALARCISEQVCIL